MSKSSPRLGRPGSAGSKSPGVRKELQGNRSCMLRIGERLMRAGSEGNLVQRVLPAQTSSAGLTQGSNSRTPAPTLEDQHSTEDTGNTSSTGETPSRNPGDTSSSSMVDSSTERLLQKKNHSSSGALFCNPAFSSAPRSPSTLPRSSASSATGSRGSQSDIPMKMKDVEKKKEVFLDVLRQKYPHHAAIIMGHQPGNTWSSDNPPSSGGLVLEEEQDPLETMSDGDLLPPTDPFTRGCKTRASLPVGRSGGQTGERQHGVVYLQYGEETKQMRMPAEISSQDSLRALFVTAFPHQLTMKMLQSPNVAIYIKDTSRNFYYELDDIRNISSHSCLKVYHKDPAHVFNRHARPAAAEGRISKEVLYGSHSPVHSRSSTGRSALHSLQGSMSPPMVRSMPSSPSRRVYGGGSTGGGAGDLGSSTLPRERLSGAGLTRSLCTNSSSSILERRDVKPDEDAGSTKSMALVLRGEGGPHYPDSYSSSVQDGGGRLSISSSQCSAPPSLASDLLGDSGGSGIPGTLQQYRASIKPLMGYGETLDHKTRSLHRQKSRKYGDSQLPPLGTKTPPPSPQRVSEVRLTEGQIIGGVGLVSADRMSPMRRSLRRDSNGAAEMRSRGNGSSSSTSSVFVDSPLGTPERLFQGQVTPSAIQSERMKAMEEQIASLAGLVHHALSMGAEIPGVKEALGETAGQRLLIPGVSPEQQNPAALIDGLKTPPLALRAPPPDSELQQSLMSAKRNVCELRVQLNQLRHQQLLNQQSVRSMLHTAGQELLLLMCDRVSRCEEAAFRRRAEMEEERMLYLRTEEAVLTQLSELEVYVDHLQRSSASSPGQLSITLRDVEEAAVNLRRVGEALSVLKGEFPELQLKLRSVLRLEVDAVRFLKEEPLKMDTMLRRVRGLTEALSSLRRCVSESTNPVKPAQDSLDGSASPILVRRMKSTAASGVQPQNLHHPSPPLTPTYGRDSPSVAKVSPRSREGSPALQRRPGPALGPGQEGSTDQSSSKLTHTLTETAHRQPPEGSLSKETSSTSQSRTRSGSTQSPSTSTDPPRLPRGGRSEDRPPGQRPESEQDTPEDTASEQQEVPANRLSDNTDSAHLTPADTAPAASQPPSAPSSAPSSAPPSAPLSSERSSRPQVEKPRRSSLEKDLKQSPDRAGRSPPPPPPRRFHSASSGVNAARPAEEELTRREPLGAQDEGDKDKEPPVPPQPKPPRQPPEVKPKPVLSAPPAAAAPPAASSSRRDEEEEIMKELQGATNLSNKNTIPGSDKWTGPLKTPATAQVTNQSPSDPQVAPQLGGNHSPPQKDGNTEALGDGESPEMKKDAVVQQATSLKCSSIKKVEVPPPEVKTPTKTKSTKVNSPVAPPDVQSAQNQDKVQTPTQKKALRKENLTPTALLQDNLSTREQDEGQVCSPTRAEKMEVPPPVASADAQHVEKKAGLQTPTQQKAKTEGLTDPQGDRNSVPKKVGSPTTAEKKVKVTTIVTLQKDSTQTGAEQTQERAVREAPAERKSNLMVVVTLQKEHTAEVEEEEEEEEKTAPQAQHDESLDSHQDCPASPPVLKRYPPSPDLTYTGSTELQSQEETEQGPRYQSQYTADGGSLSPDVCGDEGPPPPPPPTGKISLRISKAKSRILFKDEDQTRTSGSDTQTAAGGDTGEATFLEHENQGFQDSDDFDNKPIIVILDEPMDFQSAFKRLSTIFESEEDLDRILSQENLMDEDELQQQGQDTDMRSINITDINTGLKGITGNGQISIHQNPPQNQDQGQPASPRKTETKKKFKFKFPKNKLAAISQAIRSGTKAGKKPLEVVVYEEEEETASDSRSVMETKKQAKDSKRFHINSDDDTKVPLKSPSRVEELCKSAFDSINSLEESIKLLEISMDSITAPSSPTSPVSSPPQAKPKDKVKREREKSPSKRPASQVVKGPNPPQSKRVKAQPAPETGKTSTKKQTSSSPAQRPHTKSRHSSSSGSEKTPKNQPANQKQSSQADSSRAAGDSTRSVVALRASKIPALCQNSGKHLPSSPSSPHCTDTNDCLQNLCYSSSSSSSSSSSAASPSAPSASSGKNSLLSAASNINSSPPSSALRSRQQVPSSSSSLVKQSSSVSPSASPPPSSLSLSSPPPPHKSSIPSLTLARLLPSSSHVLSPSHANIGPAHHRPRSSNIKGQHRLVLTSTSHNSFYSSSSYSSSSSSPSSSSTSLSPTSSSSSPPSPSSSLNPSLVSHAERRVRASGCSPTSPGRGRKRTASASKDTP
ncbi:sickle tail protein-like [Notolabrus celidotus]|uniref:sickle tail protein-like n=1 Tax=Notolabrus celidotus TaxID=1203425 RepID=UPI00148F66F3|nr:sickle tail protein-like [Notolabrus celidotus]